MMMFVIRIVLPLGACAAHSCLVLLNRSFEALHAKFLRKLAVQASDS
jgi:hypothetical protein